VRHSEADEAAARVRPTTGSGTEIWNRCGRPSAGAEKQGYLLDRGMYGQTTHTRGLDRAEDERG